MIFTLVKNETIKILSRGKTWVVFGMFVALIGLLTYGLYRDEQNMKYFDLPKNMVMNLESQMKYLDDELKLVENSLKEKDNPELQVRKESLEIEKKEIQKNINNAKKLIEEGKGDEPYPIDLDAAIKNLEDNINDENMPKEHKISSENQLKIYKNLKENGIQPKKSYAFDGYNQIMVIISVLGMIFLVIGLSIFGSDMVSGECTPPTLKFLLVQPISRGKVLFSKFISLVMVCIIMILSVEIISFIIVGLIKGFGPSNYPMLYGTKYAFNLTKVVDGAHPLTMIEGSSEIITALAFLLRSFAYQVLFIVTVCSVVFLISTIFKSSMISMA
ncbi:ABC transporter permease subunit, partial [Clostridium sp.]|uniref:ABC transporter permease subunit n=1 Tax=Clostridium sp. TaxID=1506 RepID=UPI003463F1FB